MKTYSLSVILCAVTLIACAQLSRSSELYRMLKLKDSLLFSIGFNTYDIRQFENLVSDNFEFYHDKSGITDTKAVFISNIKDGICGGTTKSRREPDEKSFEAYPLQCFIRCYSKGNAPVFRY